jgi:hypothetical protein
MPYKFLSGARDTTLPSVTPLLTVPLLALLPVLLG